MSVTWRDSRPLMARTAAWMVAVGALLASVQLLAASLPTSSLTPAVTVGALGIVLALCGERVHALAVPALCVALLALGAYTVSLAGNGDGALLAYMLPIIWVGCFFGRRQIIMMVCVAAVADGLALAALGRHAGRGVAWIEVVLSLGAVAVLTTMVIENYRRALAARHEEARVDPLTGLLNRRGMRERAAVELARAARRQDEALSVLAFDIDHFKKLNDDHGHDFGDRVLVRFGSVLRRQARLIDIAARTGGEEFVLVLPSCGPEDARAVADRIRADFANGSVDGEAHVTVSAGVCTQERPLELLPLLVAADRALYDAKSSGRDCIRVYDGLESIAS